MFFLLVCPLFGPQAATRAALLLWWKPPNSATDGAFTIPSHIAL